MGGIICNPAHTISWINLAISCFCIFFSYILSTLPTKAEMITLFVKEEIIVSHEDTCTDEKGRKVAKVSKDVVEKSYTFFDREDGDGIWSKNVRTFTEIYLVLKRIKYISYSFWNRQSTTNISKIKENMGTTAEATATAGTLFQTFNINSGETREKCRRILTKLCIVISFSGFAVFALWRTVVDNCENGSYFLEEPNEIVIAVIQILYMCSAILFIMFFVLVVIPLDAALQCAEYKLIADHAEVPVESMRSVVVDVVNKLRAPGSFESPINAPLFCMCGFFIAKDNRFLIKSDNRYLVRSEENLGERGLVDLDWKLTKELEADPVCERHITTLAGKSKKKQQIYEQYTIALTKKLEEERNPIFNWICFKWNKKQQTFEKYTKRHEISEMQYHLLLDIYKALSKKQIIYIPSC